MTAVEQIVSDYAARNAQIIAQVDNRYGNQRKARKASFIKARLALQATGLDEASARRLLWAAIAKTEG